MKRILLATKNMNKLREFKQILFKYDYEVISLSDLNDNDEVEETGTTFRENALIKARYYYNKYQIDTVSDDSGISIDYLNGFPGIYSARFLKQYDYDKKNNILLDIMYDVDNRKAHYTCDIALIMDGKEHVFEGIMNGTIAYETKGTNGFGYDPIFYMSEYHMNVAEMSQELKNEISHRAIALKEMVKYFEKNV